jgi:hypothetical protein
MVSLPLTTGSRMLHRVVEGETATGGGAVTVTVNPPVRPETAAVGSLDVRLIRAPALFVVKNDSLSAPDGELSAPVSFEAVQTVRAV